MRLHRFAIPAAILFWAVAGFAPAGDAPERVAFDDRERARLVAHFDSVLLELQQRDVSHLSADRLAARRRHIENLRQYRDAGVFPHNHVTSTMTPVFVDEHGTHCAMGYLIARDGRTDLVARINSSRNLARIHDLAVDTALVSWLDRNGITVDEAARVQPAYDGPNFPDVRPPEPVHLVRSEVVLGSFAYAGAATIIAIGNVRGPGEPRRYNAGALLGFAGFALALQAREGDGATDVFAAANAAMAVTSFVLAARSASRDPARINQRNATRPATTAFTAGPLMTPQSTGIVARLTF